MAGTVYSTRFLAVGGTGWHYYTVPAGYRAVVRCASSIVWGTSASWQTLNCGGVAVWFDPDQAAGSIRILDGRWVAYAGETIGTQSSHTDTNWVVNGYLFRDPAMSSELEPPQIYVPPTPPPPPEMYDPGLLSRAA